MPRSQSVRLVVTRLHIQTCDCAQTADIPVLRTPLSSSEFDVGHRLVNTRPQGRLRQRRARTRRFSRNRCLGGWVDDHRVAEVFELGDQPSGVGFVVASAVPIRAQVVVRLVAF